MKNTSVIMTIFASFVLASCVSQTVAPTLTPVQKQQIQARTYDSGQSKDDLFNSVLSVFQDKGYIIESANRDTGIVTATSETQDNSTGLQKAFGVTVTAQSKVTATVLQYGAGIRVRLNFLNIDETKRQQCNAWGTCNTLSDVDDSIIYDSNVYTSVFNAIDDALFIISAGGTEVTN